MSTLAPRPGIMKIAPYVPGKDSVEGKETIAKLSSNEGALGPSPKAMAAYAKDSRRTQASGTVTLVVNGATVGKLAYDKGHQGALTLPLAQRRRDAGDLDHVREHLDPERAQELLAQRAAGDARRGLPRGRAFEHIAHVREAELHRPDQIGVPGTR